MCVCRIMGFLFKPISTNKLFFLFVRTQINQSPGIYFFLPYFYVACFDLRSCQSNLPALLLWSQGLHHQSQGARGRVSRGTHAKQMHPQTNHRFQTLQCEPTGRVIIHYKKERVTMEAQIQSIHKIRSFISIAMMQIVVFPRSYD